MRAVDSQGPATRALRRARCRDGAVVCDAASPPGGRGFEPHICNFLFIFSHLFCAYWGLRSATGGQGLAKSLVKSLVKSLAKSPAKRLVKIEK